MLYIAHCDNNGEFLTDFSEKVTNFLLNHHIQFEIKTFEDTEIFLKYYKKKTNFFQVIFLEADLKKVNGLALGEYIRKSNKNVLLIYVTSNTQYVYKAFALDVFRYIRKEKLEEELGECLNAVYRKLIETERKYTFKIREGSVTLKASEVMYFYFVDRHVEIHTAACVYHTTVYRLKDIEEKWIEECFVRIHRSCIVNMEYVQKIAGQDLVLINGEQLPISRYKQKMVKQMFTRQKK